MQLNLSETCYACGLSRTRKNIVWGEGPQFAQIMFLGQDPGGMEDIFGTPFYYEAPVGQEFDRLLGTIGLARETVYVSNTAKCHTPGDRGPTPDEMSACRPWLLMEIATVRPKVIVTLGATATAGLLGNVDMESVHGIPFKVRIPEIDFETIVVPAFHPGAGLRNSDYAKKCLADFQAAGAVLRNKLSPAHFKDPLAGTEVYRVLETPKEAEYELGNAKLVAVDTETLDWNYTPFTVQFSVAPGTGFVTFADNAKVLAVIAEFLKQPDVITIIHNALFDLFVLERLRIKPATVRDTMVMAYLLQTEPLGLKPLAFRYWGMKMRDYEEMIALASADLAEKYLQKVLEIDWPMADKIEQIKKDGSIHLKQPQHISKTVKRIFADLAKHKIGRADLWTRWHNLKPEETSRGLIEEILGEMPEGNLSMIDPLEAVFYGARDADATIRIYPYLWSMIQDQGMEGVFDLDMGIIPMVKDMMATGILADRQALDRLGDYFQEKLDAIYAQVTGLLGTQINLRSHLQVKELLYEKLRLHKKHNIKFKKQKLSTDDKALARMTAFHPVVPLIRTWKGYNSLVTKYTSKLGKWIKEDGRIHANLGTTRTATGRLCVHPDTLVEAPRNMTKYPAGIPIRDLKAGDFVYSFDWKRELVIRRVNWVGPTGVKPTIRIRYQSISPNAPVLELLVSPEHLVRLYDGRWKHAGHLKPGERLLSMVSRANHGQGYFAFYSHSRNRANGKQGGGKIKEHRFIYSQVVLDGAPLGAKTIIHHKDGNPKNNVPSNLTQVTSIAEHQVLHKMSKEEYRCAIETGVGRRGKLLKETTVRAYVKRLRNLELEESGLLGVNHIVLSVEGGPETELWDLEIEDTHTFIGNEVALHNSASKPNIMNQPTRTEDGKEIRKCYYAKDGCLFVSNDLSQIEMRKLADESGDPLLLDIFRNDKDIHAITASNIFGLPVDKLDDMKHRYPAKRVGFGVVYGITAAGLQEQLLMIGLDPDYWSITRCQQLIDDWFELYHDVDVYMQDLVRFAIVHGYVEDMFGRRRYLENVNSSSKRARAEAYRQAGNMPIQSGAAGIFKMGMKNLIPIYRDFLARGYYIKPIIPIHDDLVFEVEEDLVDIWVPLQQDVMEHSVTLKVPIKSDAKVGKIWGEMEKYSWQ